MGDVKPTCTIHYSIIPIGQKQIAWKISTVGNRQCTHRASVYSDSQRKVTINADVAGRNSGFTLNRQCAH
jgi:hypothetical protein